MAIATSTRLSHVQTLRGFAAMLVLFSHLFVIEGRASANPILPEAATFGMMGVDLFFVISGFIMVYVTREWAQSGIGKGARIWDFLFARVSRIYPLYWVVSAAVLAVWIVRPDLVFSSSENDPQLLNSLLLMPAWAYPLLEVGWTLVFEMGFYLVFALLLFLPRRLRPAGLCLWGGAVALGLATGLSEKNPLFWHLFHPLTFEFLAGAFAARLFLRFDGSIPLAYVLILLGLSGFLFWTLLGGDFENGWWRVIRFTLPSVTLLLGAAWLDRHEVGAWQPAITLGDWSYSLYLTHLLSLSVIALIWRRFGFSDLPSILFLLVATVAAIIVSGLTYRLIEAPLLARTRSIRRAHFQSRSEITIPS